MPSGGKISLNFPRDTAAPSGTAMPFPQPPIPVVTRQHSYTTLSRLLRAASIGNNRSPDTPSPAGAAQLRSIVQRLEDIDAESRQLLTKLFSMLQKDARLERYVRRRLDDPKVSRMWELVEQILDCQKGGEPLDLEMMLGSSESGGSSSDGGSGSGRYDAGRGELSRLHKLTTDKGLRVSEDDQDMMGIGDGDWDESYDGLKLERFKIRTLDSGGGVDTGEVQPNDQTKDKGGSG